MRRTADFTSTVLEISFKFEAQFWLHQKAPEQGLVRDRRSLSTPTPARYNYIELLCWSLQRLRRTVHRDRNCGNKATLKPTSPANVGILIANYNAAQSPRMASMLLAAKMAFRSQSISKGHRLFKRPDWLSICQAA